MKNIIELFNLSNSFYKLAEHDFLSKEERDNYFNDDYLVELLQKASLAYGNIANARHKHLINLYQKLENIYKKLDDEDHVNYDKNTFKNHLIGYLKFYFDAINDIIDFNVIEELNIDCIWPSSAIDNTIHEKIESEDIEKIPYEKIIQLLENMNVISVNINNAGNFNYKSIINWYLNSIPKIIKLSRLFNQVLILFGVYNFNQYFEQIVSSLKKLYGELSHYNKYEKPEQKDKKFEIWVKNKISDYQLAGEYPDVKNLTWKDLNEEDKLMLLESYNLKPTKL